MEELYAQLGSLVRSIFADRHNHRTALQVVSLESLFGVEFKIIFF